MIKACEDKAATMGYEILTISDMQPGEIILNTSKCMFIRRRRHRLDRNYVGSNSGSLLARADDGTPV